MSRCLNKSLSRLTSLPLPLLFPLAEDLQLPPFASLPLFMILTLPASVYFHFMPNPGWSRSSVSNGKSRSQGISSHPFPFFLL